MMKDSFFTKLDWAAFWTATLAVFAVYFFTLGPSVGLEDSGELATAGAHLGVPHPPGYPFWTLCSWIFTKLFFWVTYMGHPTPAWSISLCSAVFGAFAAGFTAMLICRSSHDFVEDEASTGVNKWLCFGGGVAGALTFALSPVEWSQSTIVEVYSLNAFFLMWVFLLSYRWMRQPTDKILWITAFVFGLGLTNYQVLLFAIVPLTIIIALKNIGMFRDVFIYLIPVALSYQILQIGQLGRADYTMQSDVINKHVALMKSTECPSSTLIILSLVIVLGSIIAGIIMRRRDEEARAMKVTLYGGGFGAALLFLAATIFTGTNEWSGIYEPVAPLISPARYAIIGAMILGSVVCAATAALKLKSDEKIFAPSVIKFVISAVVLAIIAIVVASMVPTAGDDGYMGAKYPWAKSTFVFWLLILSLFGLCSLTKKGLLFAIPVAAFHIAAFTLLRSGAMNGLTHPMSWWFGWPIAWNFILLALTVITLPNGKSVAGAAFFAQLGVSFYAYMPIVSDLRNPPMNWGYPRTWEGFKHAIMRGQYEAIGFQIPKFEVILNYFEDVKVQFTDVLIPFALVPFAAGHRIVRKEHRKAYWQWMIPAFVCFFLMSFLLIALANVKGDVQDGFIQKVKFISSHAMLALWIGYGLVFAGIACIHKSRIPEWVNCAKPKLAMILGGVMIVISFIYPLIDNYCGNYVLGVNEVAFKLGGSEQNGHTFGWQFGAYQLEGYKAINEQLVEDEEPLPDPNWPEPMEKSSIFFGGTDPGRFVPTYMIYSANFRPDVYLITQNALADDTYMSVERDLYGDEIWIPAKEDSAEAFNIYVDEVQRGVRQANGDLRIENGRVQVTGALGVMEINGILTKMMFDHDRLRHSFYVEESYVIPWMYPYLSPHGLIMKINANKTPYNELTAKKDAEFWDWYTRRLLKDPMYRRDFAGQKSFSKLRAAIAGLYVKQGHYQEGSQAFREAVLLYPASPEATFRYAQECLLPFRKYDITLELMDYTDHIDPNNKRTTSLRNYISRFLALQEGLARLGAKLQKGTITLPEKLELARLYRDIGRVAEAAQLVRSVLPMVNDALALETVIDILLDARQDADAEAVIPKYLKLKPKDDKSTLWAWIELAKLQFRANKKSAAIASFNQAVVINREAVSSFLQKDQELANVYMAWLEYIKRQQKSTRNW